MSTFCTLFRNRIFAPEQAAVRFCPQFTTKQKRRQILSVERLFFCVGRCRCQKIANAQAAILALHFRLRDTLYPLLKIAYKGFSVDVLAFGGDFAQFQTKRTLPRL